MRSPSVAVAALLLVVGGLTARLPDAYAAGGSWPSTAVRLPLERTHTGGSDDVVTSAIVDPEDPQALRWHAAGEPGVEYWAITLEKAQQVVIDLTHERGAGVTRACILPWWTSDRNIAETACLTGTEADAQTSRSFAYSPARDATVYLAVWDEACCGLDDWAYTVTAHSPTDTTLRLHRPTTRARPGDTITVSGRLDVVVPQPVTIQRRKWWKTTSWFKPTRTVTTSADGTFAFSYRIPRTAKHPPAFHAKYQGSVGYRPSESNTIVVRLRRG